MEAFQIKQLFFVSGTIIIAYSSIYGMYKKVRDIQTKIEKLDMEINKKEEYLESLYTNLRQMINNFDTAEVHIDSMIILKNINPESQDIKNLELMGKKSMIHGIAGKFVSLLGKGISKNLGDELMKLTPRALSELNNELAKHFFDKMNKIVEEKKVLEKEKEDLIELRDKEQTKFVFFNIFGIIISSLSSLI